MTDAMMRLRTLLEKSSDADLLREMVGFAAQRLMELDRCDPDAAAGGYGRRHRHRAPGKSTWRDQGQS
jgi:putative transposase